MNPYPGAFAIVLVLIILIAIIGTVAQHLRARRNERRCATRMDWLQDDVQ